MLHGRWTEENRTALERLMEEKTGESPIAVFDWDNTCIRGDISDAVFHQLCADLAFDFEAPGFWEWVTEACCQDSIGDAYSRYRADPQEENRAQLRDSLEATRKALHESMDDTSAWAWDTGAFIGWTARRVRNYTRSVIHRELADGPVPEISGGVISQGKSALGLRPEMRELIKELADANWRVWILSASPQWQVDAFAEMYDVPWNRVVGMRREIVEGKISLQVIPPVSYSDGKLDAYRMFISSDRAPSLVAGDSLGDWKMLESADGVHLLLEPVPGPLRQFAEWRRSAGEVWLFQELD